MIKPVCSYKLLCEVKITSFSTYVNILVIITNQMIIILLIMTSLMGLLSSTFQRMVHLERGNCCVPGALIQNLLDPTPLPPDPITGDKRGDGKG